MDFHEPPRARRRRHRDALTARHRRRAADASMYPGPEDWHRDRDTGLLEVGGCWYDFKGQRHDGPVTWEDVHAARDRRARITWDNATPCSCWMCGNPRRWTNAQTRPEHRAALDAAEQFAEAGRHFRPRFRTGG